MVTKLNMETMLDNRSRRGPAWCRRSSQVFRNTLVGVVGADGGAVRRQADIVIGAIGQPFRQELSVSQRRQRICSNWFR